MVHRSAPLAGRHETPTLDAIAGRPAKPLPSFPSASGRPPPSPRSDLGMAAGVALDPQPANPCCAELKKRYLKLEEKRNALRQAVKLLEGQANKLQDENAALKELCEKECKRADLAQQAKEKESDVKSILKKEIQDLKSEIASLQGNGNLRDQDRNQLLETRILQGEAEIKRLKEQLQKEIKRAESEKKKVMEEKKKTAEAWELVKIEKCRAEEEKRIADIERKKAEDVRHSLAKVKPEASEARDHVSEERKKAELANKKVELERQKVCREKKRADLERARFEEQRELVEIERKKTVDEKDRADHLLQQLEEERQMRAELQKEMEKILSHQQGPKSCLGSYKTEQVSGSKEDTQSENIKLLKNKLKLGRNELKHSKRMVKLEKAEKRLLLQQLYLLKQDHLQFSHRLEMLIDCSSYCVEGTDGLEKVDGSLMRCAKPCATRPQRKCVCAEHDFNSQIETNTNCMGMEYMGPITSCTWHLHQKCGGRSTRPISGISSDLESPVGDSVRDKPQNSAVCSTAVTYSDTQLMGSQGRSTFAVPTSAKMVMDNFQGLPSSNFTGETKNLHVVQQGNDGICHSKMEFPCMKHIVGNGIQIAKNDSQCNRGKRKAPVIVDAADCSCCLKISNDNSVFEDINSKSFVPPMCRSDDISSLNGGKNLTTELSDDSDTRNCQFHMKEKSSKRQKLGLQPSDNIDNHKEVYRYEMDGHNETCINEATLPFPGAGEHALTCRNKSDDVFMDDRAALVRLETIISEDYMKLLDLDDDAEEERYQAARERPLSPTLPELEPPSRSSLDKCCASDGKCDSMKEKLIAVVVPQRLNRLSASSSQEQLDCHLIPEKINPCNTSEDIDGALLLMSNSECIQLPLDGCAHVASSSDTGASLTDVDRESRSNMQKETVKQMSLSEDKELECANRANGQHWRIDGCCVIFSNTKDEEVISRVLCTRSAIIHDISQGGDTGFSVAMVLHALAANLNLSAEEKACILFSLLLCKVSAMIPVDPATHTGDLSLESELVMAEMDRVFSDDDTRPIFFATCLLDIFVSLIQDFLTARKVMVCGEREPDLCSSDTVYHLDNESRTWIMKTAAVTQLVAGSVILASICTVYGRVDILWQTSFQLLQMCRNDPYWILTAVHVFASICGVKFFSPTHHNLIVTAIKSLILLLERGEEFGSITSIGDKCPRFCVCVDCPFAEGQVCVDKVMSHLLEELQICLASAARNPDSKKLLIFSYSTCHPCNGHDAQNNQFDVSSKECDAFCSSHDDVHDQNTEAGFCHLTDIISLVELFGHHTGWECVHRKIIPQLFTLSESCSSSAFSVSFLVLIGQLGRIGVETGDCDQRDVEGLMCSLSMFMDVDRTGKSGLPVQFAAVDALLNLLPLDFGEIVEGPLNVSLAPSQVTHAEHIRRWFQQLGEEQKAVSLRLFQDSNLKKS